MEGSPRLEEAYFEGTAITGVDLADGCVIEGEVVNSIIFRGTKIEKGCRVENSILMQDTVVGENIVLNTSYGKYVYKVVSKDIFEKDDNKYIVRNEGEMLTIYTCYPKKGPYRKQRIAITGLLQEELSDPTWR